MPYRALMWTMVSVGLALLVVALWARAVAPILSSVTESLPLSPPTTTSTNPANNVPPATSVHVLVRGTMLLAFLLVTLLLVVGLHATYREWMRRVQHRKKSTKTPYVDAWKLAGERLGKEPPKE